MSLDARACHCGRPYDIRTSAMAQCDDCTSLQEDDEPVTRDRVRCPGCGAVLPARVVVVINAVDCPECEERFGVEVTRRFQSPPMRAER